MKTSTAPAFVVSLSIISFVRRGVWAWNIWNRKMTEKIS
jgi:hypothetical protein